MTELSKNSEYKIISNAEIDSEKLQRAEKIITDLQISMPLYTKNGSGPFVAAVYDKNGNLLVQTSNSVVIDNCSHNHAEMNAIKEVQKKLGTYDLSLYELSLYITAEPCMMCIGAILWSGIKEVYFGVPSSTVEKITGFDEGFKPEWLEEFKKRGITVYGNIEPELGEKALLQYVNSGNKIYKPERKN